MRQVLLSSRLLVLNDKNKRKFAQNGMIPFVLSLLKVTPVPSRCLICEQLRVDVFPGRDASFYTLR